MTFSVAAFYRFTPLADLPTLQEQVHAFCQTHEIIGIILLAPEGINSTIAGSAKNLGKTIDFLDGLCGIRKGELKFSSAEKRPFRKLRVRLKKEIVTLKKPEADPNVQTGQYVPAQEWNALTARDDMIVIDTRNGYEVELGKFRNAVDPQTDYFSHFPDYVAKNLDPAKHKNIAMYCTGGIRCEKASSYLLAQGFENVYQLDGGILKYLETVPAEESTFDGSCFVFDRRIALGHGLVQEEPPEGAALCPRDEIFLRYQNKPDHDDRAA